MRMRASLRRDPLAEKWLLSLWYVDGQGRYLFGQKPFEEWQEALNWGLWRVGLRPTHG